MSMNPSRLYPATRIYLTVRRQELLKKLISLYRKRRLVKEGKKKVRVIKMEIRNLELVMENQSIIEENEKLRRKALQLQQENKDLLTQPQKVPQNEHSWIDPS